MALLFTNADGFRARVVFESAAPSQAPETTAGELMVRDSKLLFAPAPRQVAKKQPHPEDPAFVWDVNEDRGCVLNEPLQAYAPISLNRQFTDVTTGKTLKGASPEHIAGHPCQATEATDTASDGVAMAFRVWRATDLKGLPLRIECPLGGVPLTLTLSKVRLGALELSSHPDSRMTCSCRRITRAALNTCGRAKSNFLFNAQGRIQKSLHKLHSPRGLYDPHESLAGYAPHLRRHRVMRAKAALQGPPPFESPLN